MMPILNAQVVEHVRKAFADLDAPVRLVFFERSLDCDTCPDARRLLEELSEISDKVSLEIHNIEVDREKAREFKVDKVPALAVVGSEDRGVRFYGVPSGYEFGTLIETIQDISTGRIDLKPETVEALKGLAAPVHLEVFVTPT